MAKIFLPLQLWHLVAQLLIAAIVESHLSGSCQSVVEPDERKRVLIKTRCFILIWLKSTIRAMTVAIQWSVMGGTSWVYAWGTSQEALRICLWELMKVNWSDPTHKASPPINMNPISSMHYVNGQGRSRFCLMVEVRGLLILRRESRRTYLYVHYVPHHAIVREDKTITNLRIVYDASARSTGLSLNDCLYTGPQFSSISNPLSRFSCQHWKGILDYINLRV